MRRLLDFYWSDYRLIFFFSASIIITALITAIILILIDRLMRKTKSIINFNARDKGVQCTQITFSRPSYSSHSLSEEMQVQPNTAGASINDQVETRSATLPRVLSRRPIHTPISYAYQNSSALYGSTTV